MPKLDWGKRGNVVDLRILFVFCFFFSFKVIIKKRDD
jgi:hypothetical protein